MDTTFDLFFFARPWWLLLLLPILLSFGVFIKRKLTSEQWNQHIDPELLDNLIAPSSGQSNQYIMPSLATLIATLLVIALAGPSFQSDEVQSIQSDDTLVIVMDLSLSMTAEDIKPSRLERAQFKIQDLLDQRTTGHTALVVYSGDAHVVVPLTKDAETIKHLAKSLNPWMIPSKGSRLYRAIEEANKLLDAYPSSNSRILLMTDEISDKQLSKTLNISKYPTYVIGVGSETGAPIHLPDKKLLKDRNQNIVIAKFNDNQPRELANKTGAVYKKLSVNNSDIKPALNYQPEGSQQESNDKLTSIQDYGYLFAIPVLILMLLSFRRGWLLLPLFIILQPTDSYAFSWEEAWQTDQQRAQQAYNEGRYGEAAELFSDPIRKGNAFGKADKWEEAEQAYAQSDLAAAQYNLANAQARQGKFDEALNSYQQAIEKAEKEGLQEITDQAKKDIDLIEKLKQENQNQDSQDQNSQQGDQNQEQDNGQNSDQQQNADKQNNDQQNNKQQDNQQQNNDQQNQQSQQSQEQDSANNQSQQSQGDDQTSEQSQQSKDEQQGQSGEASDAELTEEQAQAAADKAEQAEQEMRQQQTQAAQGEQQDQPTDNSANGVADFQNSQPLTQEQIEEEKYQQILRKIQTDPSLLLENKFRIQHYQRNQPANESQVW